MFKKSYNVILNSTNKISTGSSLSDCTYGFDWTLLPLGNYYVRFTFISKLMNLSVTDMACINVNLSSQNVFQASNRVAGLTTNFIGIAKANIISTTSYLLSEEQTNIYLYLNARPSNALINVIINNNDNTTLFTPDVGAMVDYILQLQFIEV